jgi:PadR family transcriptional regulator, regulatory protein PadR
MSRTRALSPHARTVLAVLLDARGRWSHGYELARLANVKSGTLYPLLIRPLEACRQRHFPNW